MEAKRLGSRQLFNMKRETLEKRVIRNYEETHDHGTFVEYAVAIMIRNALILEDFSCLFHEIIKDLFLTAAPCDTMRRFLPLFELLFDQAEWQQVVLRLFDSDKNYQTSTKAVRICRDYLKDKDPRRMDALANHPMILQMIFKDEKGRKHTWVLKDAHPTKEREEIEGVLQLLTMLTIFESNGTRKFVEIVDFERYGRVSDLHYKEAVEELPQGSTMDKGKKENKNSKADLSLKAENHPPKQTKRQELPEGKQMERHPGHKKRMNDDRFLIVRRDDQPKILIPIPEGKSRNKLTYDEIRQIEEEYFARVDNEQLQSSLVTERALTKENLLNAEKKEKKTFLKRLFG